MNEYDLLIKALKKYRFHQPMPDEVQERLPQITKDTLTKILKKEKRYNILTSLAISLLFKLKNFGLSISLVRSSFFVGAASFATASIIIATAILSILEITVMPVVEKGHVICSIGDVIIHRRGEKPRALKLRDTVTGADIIETGKNSQATLQFGSEFLLHLQPRSRIDLVHIFSNGKNEIFLETGELLARFKKLRKEYTYQLKTPTVVASVRGTEFSISYKQDKTIIAVSKGRVFVTITTEKEVEIIKAGQTGIFTDTIKIEKISKAGLKLLDKVGLINIIDNIEEKSESEFEDISRQIKNRIKKIDKEHNRLSYMSLSEIRKKYGRIAVVTLYNSRKIQGIIVSKRGNIFKMLTPHGYINLPKSKIKFTSIK